MSTSIALLPIETVCQQLFHVNKLIQFKLTETEMEDWSRDIAELSPNTTAGELKLVLDKFKTNRTKWDVKQGIQNIFRGIELLKLNKGEYFCEEKQMKYRNYCTSPNSFIKIYENDREF